MAKRMTTEQPAQPPFYVGMPVTTDAGATGTIVQIMPDLPDADGGLRIAWEGGESTLVSQRECVVEAGRAIAPAAYAETGTDTTGDGAEQGGAGAESAGMARGDDRLVVADEPVTVPVVEERIVPEAVWRDAGTVVFHVRTEDVPQTVQYEDAREEVVIEETAIGRELRAGERIEPRTEGDTTIIPVIREEVVMTTRRVLEKEVRVTKRVVRTPRTAEMTVRQQRVEMDGGEMADYVRREPTPLADAEQG